MNDFIPIKDHPFLKKDPHSKAILNFNNEKKATLENIKTLSNKYIQMEKKVDNIDNNLNDLKQLLEKIIKEKNN